MSCCARVSFWMMFVVSVCGTAICCGQQSVVERAAPTSNSIEFLESSSPLPGGGRVVSKSSPDNSQITTTVEAEQGQIRRNSSQSAPQRVAQNVRRLQSGIDAAQPSTAATRMYSYPATAIPSQVGNATRSGVVAAYPAFRARKSNVESADFFAPTLGITPRSTASKVAQPYGSNGTVPRTTARVAQNCDCQPAALRAQQRAQQSNLRVQGFSVPSYSSEAATTAPSLSIEDPQENLQYNPGTLQQNGFNQQATGIGVPKFDNRNQWWTPSKSGSGGYQPLIRLANMRPGTYLGQGVIGQPTAYVDGQPIRNLLRYIFP